MNENHLNTAKGRDFQHVVRSIFEEYFNTPFDLEVPFLIGTPQKFHRFDCASQDKKIVIECKCHSWTIGGNIPSAKMTTINEAAFYMNFLPQDIRKIIVMKKSVLIKRSETLAEYYCRINGHLLGLTEVFEVDDAGSVRIIRGKPANVFHEEKMQPSIQRLPDISTLWNHGSEEAWESALDYYWDLLIPTNVPLEQEFENLDFNVIKQMSVHEFYQFLHNNYFVWKYTAANRLATTRANLVRYQSEKCMDDLEQIQRLLFSFDRSDIQKGLEIAKRIKGLGIAGASGLLSIMFPRDFGTDRWTPRLIDKVLWCVGR